MHIDIFRCNVILRAISIFFSKVDNTSAQAVQLDEVTSQEPEVAVGNHTVKGHCHEILGKF